MNATRPLYWSVRRELWETRSLYLAPIGVAGVAIFGFVISTIGLPHRRRAALLLDPAHRKAAVMAPYDVVAMMLLFTAFVIAIFYCLEALHSERRDRSILFWKSLPVSDATTVASKVLVPIAVLPAIMFIVIAVLQFAMLLWTTLVLLPAGLASTTWNDLNLLTQWTIQFYALIVIPLWHAPVYAWLLLVSAWARRAPFLWAVLPLMVTSILEKIIFNTQYFSFFLRYRLFGGIEQAFAIGPRGRVDSLAQLTPGSFFGNAGLWTGLVFAALCLAIAMRLRRYREPI